MRVTSFQNYIKRRERRKMCMEIVEEIHDRRNNGHAYGIEDMKELAERFLESIEYSGDGAVPIIKIVQQSGFEVIWGLMKENGMSGFVSVNEKNKEKYNSDKIIGINGNDELGHQRFVIAHEFAHYLFDYDMKGATYFDTYIKNSHKSREEQRANKFAANLLVPGKYFALRYDEEKSMDKNIEEWERFFEVQKKAVEKRVVEVIAGGI